MLDDDSRARDTRFVKKEGISATCLSVVVFTPSGVFNGIVTSPHASIGVSVPPVSTKSSAAGDFRWNSAWLLQM